MNIISDISLSSILNYLENKFTLGILAPAFLKFTRNDIVEEVQTADDSLPFNLGLSRKASLSDYTVCYNTEIGGKTKIYLRPKGEGIIYTQGVCKIYKADESGDLIGAPQTVTFLELNSAPNNEVLVFDAKNSNGFISFFVEVVQKFIEQSND